MNLLKSKSIYFDDVNLIAAPQDNLQSRTEVLDEKWRIFVSPMPSVVGKTFAIEAIKLGLTVGLHRFSSSIKEKCITDQIEIFNACDRSKRIFGSVSLGDLAGAKSLARAGIRNIIIDVANGYLSKVSEFANNLDELGMFDCLVFGNVHSADGFFSYRSLNMIPKCLMRVGIGNGAMCTTTKVATGFGRGQITELLECSSEIQKSYLGKNFKIIADGGIRSPADAMKAFGAGADYVMLGTFFANCFEAENVVQGDFKHFGCASDHNQERMGGKKRHAEGISVEIPRLHQGQPSLGSLINEFWGGIRSGVSYSGYSSLEEFIGHGQFELKHGQ